MAGLGDVVRRIRKDLGATQAIFAQSLGVDQTAVSHYETGRIVPSTDVLLILHGLASNREAQGSIRKALGSRVSRMSDSEMSDLLASIEKSPEAIPDMAIISRALKTLIERTTRYGRFLKEAQKLIESGLEVPPSLSDIVRLYREHGRSPKVRTLFQKALGYLEVEIHEQAGITASARRQKRDCGKHQA
jgi:transcriptional regulator with XRE-family HTH domain